MCSLDVSAEIGLVGGGRKKTLDSCNGENYSGIKNQQEEEPNSLIKGRTIVRLEQVVM